ncbi:unnamed protein product, partial [Owenia fusiformis]
DFCEMTFLKQQFGLILGGIIIGILICNIKQRNHYRQKSAFDVNMFSRVYERSIIRDKRSNQDDSTEVIRNARIIANKTENGIVAVTMVNEAYLEMTYSWLCNTVNMSVHEQVLIIATDEIALRKLRSDWPNVVSVLYSILTKDVTEKAKCAWKLFNRSLLARSLLKNNVHILLFEVDAVWFSSPFPLLQSLSHYDLVGAQLSTRNRYIAAGFVSVRPTIASRDIFTYVIDNLLNGHYSKGDSTSPDVNDQIYLHDAIVSHHTLKYKLLDFNIIEDGLWYLQLHDTSNPHQSRPVVLNNNWIIEREVKIATAKESGHWFLDKSNTCDWENVIRITKQ